MITKVQYFFLKASNTYFVVHGSNNIKVIKALWFYYWFVYKLFQRWLHEWNVQIKTLLSVTLIIEINKEHNDIFIFKVFVWIKKKKS